MIFPLPYEQEWGLKTQHDWKQTTRLKPIINNQIKHTYHCWKISFPNDTSRQHPNNVQIRCRHDNVTGELPKTTAQIISEGKGFNILGKYYAFDTNSNSNWLWDYVILSAKVMLVRHTKEITKFSLVPKFRKKH